MEAAAGATRSTDKEAARDSAARGIIQKDLAQAVKAGKISRSDAAAKLAYYDAQIAYGYSPEEAARLAARHWPYTSPHLYTGGQGPEGSLYAYPHLGADVKADLKHGPHLRVPGVVDSPDEAGGGVTVNHNTHVIHHQINNAHDPATAGLAGVSYGERRR